jgi:putative SOS response-associated peptidase YedK
MCGRYRLSQRKQIVEECFDSVSGEEDWSPRYNIAPTQPAPVIRQNPKEPVREFAGVWLPGWVQGRLGCFTGAGSLRDHPSHRARKPLRSGGLPSKE